MLRKQCVIEGLEAALERTVHANRKKHLLGSGCEARPTMLACSKPPSSHAEWSYRLLGAQLVELEMVESIPGKQCDGLKIASNSG